MTYTVYDTPQAVAEALIQQILQQVSAKGDAPFHIAFSGGSTPTLMFDIWAKKYAEQTPWQQLYFYWVDERCVPADDKQSNYGTMRQHLLRHIPLPDSQIFPIDGTENPTKEAERYAQEVKEHLPLVDGRPTFDLVLLGAGDDGHTSSIFPGQDELLTTPRWYAPSEQPVTHQRRIALTATGIFSSQQLIFLLTGDKKQPIVQDLLGTDDTGPAAYVAHRHAHTLLLVDREAAGGQ